MKMKTSLSKVPYYKQPNSWSCGPTCLKMVADYYKIINPKTGKPYSVSLLSKITDTDKEYGTQFKGMRKGTKELGLKLIKLDPWETMYNYAYFNGPLITIIPDWEQPYTEDHYIVLTKTYGYDVSIHDPYYGKLKKSGFVLKNLINNAGPWVWQVVRASK